MKNQETLYIVGGMALTMDGRGSIIENSVIEVRGGRIASVSSRPGFQPPPGARVVDADRCLVMPGLINGHTHVGMSFLRGVADDLPLDRWLHDVIFPTEKKWGSYEFVYHGTLLAALEMIRSGTTTFNDMYYFEDATAKACHDAGLRAVCGQTIVEISGVEKDSPDLFVKFDDFLEKVADYPLVTPAIAPHSIYGVSDRSWKRIIDYVTKRHLTVHVHLAETPEEEEQCQKTHGKTPTEYFDDIGLWSQRVVAAHATCVSEKEIEILGRNKVGISHNPESNLKLGIPRICPVVELRRAGARVAFGTDGVASNNNLDMLQEADTAAKLQSFRIGIGALKAEEVVKILTAEGAAAIGLGDEIGSLEVGKAADIIAIDLNKPHLIPLYNPYSHLVYSAGGADVKHTVVNGRVLMENYRILSLDEASVLKEAVRWGKKIASNP